jgi:hypothetical protein
MGKKIAMLVNRAALYQDIRPKPGQRLLEAGSAIDDDKLRPLQAAFDEAVEERPPGGVAFAAHVLDRQEDLLAVLPDAEGDEKRDRRRFLVEPHAHDRAIKDQPDDWLFGEGTGVPGIPIALHLAPHPADRIFPHRAAKQGRQRPAYPAGVGSGEIGRGNQRIGGAVRR